jgi:hypothetical protein
MRHLIETNVRIRNPYAARKVMQDIAYLVNGYTFTLSNNRHDTFIAVKTTYDGDMAYWSHDEDDCIIYVDERNVNVRTYLRKYRRGKHSGR